MPVITLDTEDLFELLGKTLPDEELRQSLTMLGGDVDAIEDDEVQVEMSPDRSDLFCVEGVARALKAFLEIEPGLGLKEYKVFPSDIEVSVSSTVDSVRPYVACAKVTDLVLNDELIRSLMDVQEKLHLTVGRKRSKVAIGVHDSKDLAPPYLYQAVEPKSVSFIPLARSKSMTLDQILETHEKGKDYAHILDGQQRYPLIVDSKDQVLSFPPIINGILTQVTDDTTEILLDVTGTDEGTVGVVLNLICTMLADRGGKLHEVTVHHPDREPKVYPALAPGEMELDIDYANRILGLSLTEAEISHSLERTGFGPGKFENGRSLVQVPAYRSDILHMIDLVEDVAIGYGYELLEGVRSKAPTYGLPLPHSALTEKLRLIMVGFGFLETITLTLSSPHEQFELSGLPEVRTADIANPITEDHTCMRAHLLPSLYQLLRSNKHRELPQRLFEVGTVISNDSNSLRLAGLEISAHVDFTSVKSYVESLLSNIGMQMEVQPLMTTNAFIDGRCAKVLVNGNVVGFFGEVHPKVITGYELEHPIVAFELELDKLY